LTLTSIARSARANPGGGGCGNAEATFAKYVAAARAALSSANKTNANPRHGAFVSRSGTTSTFSIAPKGRNVSATVCSFANEGKRPTYVLRRSDAADAEASSAPTRRAEEGAASTPTSSKNARYAASSPTDRSPP
jgi:hypothetical protein